MKKNDIFWLLSCVLGLVFCPAFSEDTVVHPKAGQYNTFIAPIFSNKFDTNKKSIFPEYKTEKINYDECNGPINPDIIDSMYYFAIVRTSSAWDRSESGFVVDANGDLFTYFINNPNSLYPKSMTRQEINSLEYITKLFGSKKKQLGHTFPDTVRYMFNQFQKMENITSWAPRFKQYKHIVINDGPVSIIQAFVFNKKQNNYQRIDIGNWKNIKTCSNAEEIVSWMYDLQDKHIKH